MAIYTSILTSGTNSHQTTSEEANRFVTNFVTPGIVGAVTNTTGVSPMTGAFAVNAQGTPDKTVTVTLGDAVVTATPSTQASQNFLIRSTANVVVTVADNVTGSTCYDFVYLAIDPIKANNPAVDGSDVTSLVVHRSTSSASDIPTGAPAYAERVARITVPSGFTTITNSQITDLRRNASAAILPGTISSTMLGTGAVTLGKVATGAVAPESLKTNIVSATLDTGAGGYSTTSTTAVGIMGVQNITTTGGILTIIAAMPMYTSSLNGYWGLLIDGNYYEIATTSSNSSAGDLFGIFTGAISAGAHTVQLAIRSVGATTTVPAYHRASLLIREG